MVSIGHTDHKEQTIGWLTLFGRILLPLGLFAIALFGGGVNAAHALPAARSRPIFARRAESSGPKAKWAANTSRGTYVQVVISAASSDPSLADLRSAVLAAGGSVLYVFQAAPALLAVLPASAVDAMSARGDVSTSSPIASRSAP